MVKISETDRAADKSHFRSGLPIRTQHGALKKWDRPRPHQKFIASPTGSALAKTREPRCNGDQCMIHNRCLWRQTPRPASSERHDPGGLYIDDPRFTCNWRIDQSLPGRRRWADRPSTLFPSCPLLAPPPSARLPTSLPPLCVRGTSPPHTLVRSLPIPRGPSRPAQASPPSPPLRPDLSPSLKSTPPSILPRTHSVLLVATDHYNPLTFPQPIFCASADRLPGGF